MVKKKKDSISIPKSKYIISINRIHTDRNGNQYLYFI